MTILNIYVDPAWAIIGTDTEGVQKERRSLACKLLPLPHISALICGRGAWAGIHHVFKQALVKCSGFDDLADQLVRPGISAAAMRSGGGVCLVGYSERAEQIVGWDFVSNGFRFKRRAIDNQLAAPWDDDPDKMPDIDNEHRMLRFANRQRDWIRSKHPEAAAGMAFTIGHIRRNQIVMRRFAMDQNELWRA